MGDTNENTNTVAKQNLHPVYTVTNIQHKVRILDGTKVSYSSWVKLFQLHARGYDVLSHIDGTPAPASTDSSYQDWLKIDSIVLQWIYGTLSDDLLVRVLETESIALQAWNRIKTIFLNNKGSRAAALEQEFTNLRLRSMPSLESYCQKLKELSDQLSDVDSPVTDQRLVLQLVRGLPAEFDTVASYINQTLPTWDTACSMLQLEHHRQSARENPQISTPVVAHVDAPPPNRRPNSGRGGGRGGSRRNNFEQRTRGAGQPSQMQWNGTPNHGQAPRWNTSSSKFPAAPSRNAPFWFNGWQGPPPPCPYPAQQGWVYPWNTNAPGAGSSTVGPSKQTRKSAQAHLTDLDALDPNAISSAFSAMATTDVQDGEWLMDTGATSHVTGDPGFEGWEDYNEA
ncbi:hypothetical protein SSX86_022472 [Deinandra increscens subsp. villosa]|uniref:Gag protein n=1 Tax=Deinandra increscens subsp. villosa TaxID=3103831 RepID=A0AAP0CKH0_9ASTR